MFTAALRNINNRSHPAGFSVVYRGRDNSQDNKPTGANANNASIATV